MSSSDKLFNIPFVGLKLGTHQFEYEINDEFFEDIEYSLVRKGNLYVNLKLEKKEIMLIANFSISGIITAECDRCTAPMEVQIKGDFQLIYKFGLENEEDESLIIIHPNEYQINVKNPIYELIMLSLPTRKIHPKGKCDEEMWELIQKYTVNPDDDSNNDDSNDDPKWSLLKNLN